VLFCDIRGFTTLTEGMDPVAVIEMLNLHMTALTNVVHRHHGVVDKFVGDALMALFGAPKSYGDDARDAASCALALLAERDRLNATTCRVVSMGIGVATGRVVAGCMGSADRLNYTVLGDRVNLAARLCARAAGGEILVDDATRGALAEAVVDTLEPLALKGISQPVSIFRLRALPAEVVA
jgi:class 3 adenylate cyclase